jgi:3-isopropylmalate/(R)-2-methylmalate dehydratase small subunit
VEPFGVLESRAVLLRRDDVDTDQIIPARYTILPRKADMAEALFRDLRDQEPGFPLDAPGMAGRRVLVVGENFGCGSSREGAVWALVGHGFRAVVGPSFADIFRNNALKNGLLLATLRREDHGALVGLLEADPGVALTIDLPARRVLAAGRAFDFPLDPFSHELLLHGHDELEYLLGWSEEVRRYEATRMPAAVRWRLQ